jgi:hypothetical protein
MSNARTVPETVWMENGELSADSPRRSRWRHSVWRRVPDGCRRFRYGDGVSHARDITAGVCDALSANRAEPEHPSTHGRPRG